MTAVVEKILGTVISAAIVGTVVFMWSVNDRLTRIEARLGIATAEVSR